MEVFYLRAGGEMLVAYGLIELAELVGLAIENGDELQAIRRPDGHLVDDTRFGRLMLLAATGLAAGNNNQEGGTDAEL